MKKLYKIIAFILIFTCLLTACKINDTNENGNDSSEDIIQELSDGADTLKPDSGGQHDFCPIHDINFHAISTSWLEYLGQDVYDEWLENKFLVAKQNPDYLDMPCGGIGITDLIHDFNISKETFYEVERPPLTQETINFYAERGEKITDDIFYNRYSYTDEQIDAFYSNDPIRIANAICGDLGFVDQTTGKIYSIYWLARHTPQDYIDAGLSMDQVETAIEKAGSDEFGLYDLAETAQQKLDIARTLSSDPGSSDEQTVSSDTSASFKE